MSADQIILVEADPAASASDIYDDSFHQRSVGNNSFVTPACHVTHELSFLPFIHHQLHQLRPLHPFHYVMPWLVQSVALDGFVRVPTMYVRNVSGPCAALFCSAGPARGVHTRDQVHAHHFVRGAQFGRSLNLLQRVPLEHVSFSHCQDGCGNNEGWLTKYWTFPVDPFLVQIA